jgi:hypothetical protein
VYARRYMDLAERIDSLRIFPRIVLILYMVAVGYTLQYYLDFEVQYQTKCDEKVLAVLLDRNVDIESATTTSCTVVTSVGRPTGYMTLLTAMITGMAGVFGFYVNSGNSRSKKENNEQK